jgi:heme exporter protein A
LAASSETAAKATPAFEARAITKYFGRTAVLRAVNVSLFPAKSHVIFGGNGAGKSTLLRIAATILAPSSGELFYEGRALESLGDRARSRIGLVSHDSFLYPDLTVRENLAFAARLYGIDETERVPAAIEWAELDWKAGAAARSLSRGMTQRLAIARTLLHQPSLLLLDEPYTGLDTYSADRLTSKLRSLVESGITLLLTTHDIERGCALADHVFVMERGGIVHDEPGPVSTETVRTQLAEARSARF